MTLLAFPLYFAFYLPMNRPAAFAADKADVEILPRRGAWITLPGISKTSLATKLVKLAEELSAKKQQ